MNAKHTPGPWIAREINSAQMIIRTETDTIATVYRMIGSPVLMDRAHEGDANARLIAEAPKMREALERFTRVSPDDDPIVMFVLVEQARAILERIDAIEGGKP